MEPDVRPIESRDDLPVSKFGHLHTVTPLSKYLALTLFVILPFLGGWVGYVLAPQKIIETETLVYKEVSPAAVELPVEPVDSVSVNEGQYSLPEDLIANAPSDCLPAAESEQGLPDWDFSYTATDDAVSFMQTLVVGEEYGSFTYTGYTCQKVMLPLAESYIIHQPTLYFVGQTEITGNDVFTEYAGLEHFKLAEGEVEKLPALISDQRYGYYHLEYVHDFQDTPGGSTYAIGNTAGTLGATTTVPVSGVMYGQFRKGNNSYYGGFTPLFGEVVTVLPAL